MILIHGQRKKQYFDINIDLLVFYNPHVLFKRFLKMQIHIPIQI
jgi:hypothetical protein